MNTVFYNDFIQGAMKNARAHDIPISGSFELTPLCNLDCRMCYVHLPGSSALERMLSGDEWIELMEQAIAHGMMIAKLTGGEAMTHPDFRRIYMYLIEQGVTVWIKTNGILLNQDMIRLFTEYPPYIVDVSLYGCDEESYEAVTGHDVFNTVTANLRAAIDAGVHVRLIVTPSACMLPWVDRVMEYARAFGADDVHVNSMLMEAIPDTGRSIADYGLSSEDYERIFRKKCELFPGAANHLTEEDEELMGELPEDAPHTLPRGLYCNAGRISFAMHWDGSLGPCPGFPRDIIRSDAKSVGFEAAWRDINRRVKDYAVPEACHACSYNTRCHYCPPQHGSAAAKHSCNPETCVWRKRQADIVEEYRAKLHSL